MLLKTTRLRPNLVRRSSVLSSLFSLNSALSLSSLVPVQRWNSQSTLEAFRARLRRLRVEGGTRVLPFRERRGEMDRWWLSESRRFD